MIEQVEQRLGSYRLIQRLGKGTFADVYLGEHLYLNTPVALKVLHSRMDAHMLEDFLTEARNISHLVHPHINRVFDFGLESDVPFLVMDYAPSGNFRQTHRVGSTLPLPTIVTYVLALASALQYTHDQHLIHRDLKPENVLIGSKHEVLLSDFGMALFTCDREVIQVKERFGTLSYMAPELIHGQPVPASDQYALAVMVYEWLCGHLPFDGLTASLSNQHLYTVPPSLCEEQPEIPLAVEQVILKGLSKEPAQRFVDVLSFARALEEASQAVSPPQLLPSLPALTHIEAVVSIEKLDTCSYRVPLPITPLIGRERESEAVHNLLLHPEVRLVTLTGPGGIGKTHLALSLGNEVQEAFDQGVCFVPLSAIYDSELVILAITQALGLSEKEDRSQIEQLKTFLRDRQLLLVLDSFEHVLLKAPLLTDLLAACPGLKILVTSRALLHIGGEYQFTVLPLEIPDMREGVELESLSQIASIALFVQRIQAMLPGFQLTDENAGEIAAICTRLEGVPLAIELAAEQCKLLPPKVLVSRLDHPLEVLAGRRRDAPQHQQTLRKTLAWNDDMLSPDEQSLFQTLAVFVGGCDLKALEAVSEAVEHLSISVLEGVRSLVDMSLVQYSVSDEGEARLSLLEMIRLYALERLAESGELERARDAHAAYYLALAEEMALDTDRADLVAPQEKLQQEAGNLQLSFEWLMERKRKEEAHRISRFLEDTQGKVSTLTYLNTIRTDRGEEEKSPKVLPLRSTEPLPFITYEELTAREIEVLRLLALGLSNKQIAERLIISPHTVNGHIHSIFSKLALNSRSAATRYALEHQLA
jgi:predicted ATPase/DNA-binding CsgD family transcriptional regulator/tRNA A-37 threonylcarbamoyl transferase component Bud32